MKPSRVGRFSLAVTIIVVMFATIIGIRPASAATVCSPATAITVPYAKDGVADVCLQASSLCGYINSWNLSTLEVNGTSYLNVYAAGSAIAPLNGGYAIHYVSTVAWGHFEIGAPCASGPTSTTAPATVTPVPATRTNTSLPVTLTKTSTLAGPSATLTRTNTLPAISATLTRTNTLPAISATPTKTLTKTNTATGPTVTRTITILPTLAATSTRTLTATVTKTPTVGPTGDPLGHLTNPFAGATFYVNHDWRGYTTFNVSTFLWLDSIAAVNGTGAYTHSLTNHLDLALAQGANAIGIVVYDLPNRDCSALSSNGELLIANNGSARYKAEYIDVIAGILGQPKYAGLRIVAVIEPDSLPNLITNVNSYAKCQEATSTTDGYVANTTYTLNKFYPIRNIYSYIDIAHAGWLGWPNNMTPAVTMISNMVKGTTNGVKSIDGFIDNTANTQVETETYLDAATMIGSNPVRSGSYFDWNDYIDESHYAAAWKAAMQAAGLPASSTNMLIDTSRNGWGGCGGGPYALQTCRPTKTSTSTVLDTYINESRIDRRPAKGDWCNQNGAGIGKLPSATASAPYQAYVWVKPPGESDGSSTLIPTGPLNPDGKGLDGMCDPNYMGNALNENMNSNALPNAPLSGAWFQAQFDQLVANKYP